MKLKLKTKILLLVSTAILGFLIALFSITKINNSFKDYDKISESSILSEKIYYYDEVLTMSARVGVFQTNDHWTQRYYKHIGLLAEAINTISKLMPEVKEELKKVALANVNLISIEEKSFDFKKLGNNKLAQELLFSNEYTKLKLEYKKSLENALNIISKNNKELSKNISSHVFISSLGLFFSLCLIIFSFIYIFKELTKQNKYVKQVLDSQTDLILITNGKKHKLINKTTLNFFGYKKFDEFKKSHSCISDFFLSEEGYLSKESNSQTWIDKVVNNLHKIHNAKMKDKDGNIHIFQVNTTGKKINNSDYVITFTDITETTNLKLNLQKQVKKQVEDIRKKDLTLIEQAKLATMGEMLENIAHQWRQPLTVISTAASAIKMQRELDLLTDEFLIKTLNMIDSSSFHLSQTIEDFRNFYKKDDLKESFNLQTAFHRAKELLLSKFKTRSIEIIYDLDDVQFIGSENEFVQVYINILSNAMDALDINAYDDRLLFVSIKKEKDCIKIKIRDNAGGIEEEYLPKIFEHKFTTKGDKVGTGIGLYMCNLIIHKHNGLIEVYNDNYLNNEKMCKGATFIIKLPLVENKTFK